MVKGITKRIIEINNTDNVYFEKIILFVRPAKSTYPIKFLNEQAKEYAKDLSGKKRTPKKKFSKVLFFVLLGLISLISIALIIEKYII